MTAMTAIWISDQNNFSYIWSTSGPDTFFQVLSQLANQLMRSSSWQPSWISDMSYFWSTSHLDTSNEALSQLTIWFRRRTSKHIFNPCPAEPGYTFAFANNADPEANWSGSALFVIKNVNS